MMMTPFRSSLGPRLAPLTGVALAVLLLLPGSAPAAALRYVATGQINDTAQRPGSTINGPEVAWMSAQEGVLPEHGRLALNVVRIDRPPAGEVSRYDQTPVQIEIRLPDLERQIPVGAADGHPELRTVLDASLVLDGTLTGIVRDDGTADLSLRFQEIRPGSLRLFTADHIRRFVFPLPMESLLLPEPTEWSGAIPAEGAVLAARLQIVPEPGTWALFLVTLAGLIRQRRRTGVAARSCRSGAFSPMMRRA